MPVASIALKSVNPARAGVIPITRTRALSSSRKPRASGGDPTILPRNIADHV